MAKLKILFLGLLFLGTPELRAETLSYSEVWRKVAEGSGVLEGASLKVRSAEEAVKRSENHWFPKVYLDARTYQTNDPGNSFFGLLSQRKVEAADFSPDALNHPGAQTFTKGTLGLDLALYEGGMKQSQVEMQNHFAESEKLNSSQAEVELYAQVGLLYGSITAIQKQKIKLKELNDFIIRLMKGYQLGSKTNPVGYSGLLGIKSLSSRILGLVEQYEAQESSAFAALAEMGVGDLKWSPRVSDSKTFVDQYFSSSGDMSYRSQSFGENVLASAKLSRMEKARYLPRVGAFAESYLFNGNRDSAQGFTAGLYLQWNLFDPADFGKYKEAVLNQKAAEKFHRAAIQQENAERLSLEKNSKALRSNLDRLSESEELLLEQTRISSSLFRSGSINILQFAEILNRRTDLISQRLDAELALLKMATESVKKSGFKIPKSTDSRG